MTHSSIKELKEDPINKGLDSIKNAKQLEFDFNER